MNVSSVHPGGTLLEPGHSLPLTVSASPPTRRAVICDADRVSARLVGRTLTACGFDATLCHTAAACERAVDEQRPDLVVLALLLPDSDGLVLLRRLRARRTDGTSLPALLMVSAVHAEDWALEAGADAFIHKPVPLRRLVSSAIRLVGADAPETVPTSL